MSANQMTALKFLLNKRVYMEADPVLENVWYYWIFKKFCYLIIFT